MKTHLKIFYIVALILALGNARAQVNANGQAIQTTKHIQPVIMVIPRVADGKDMKAAYDADQNLQVALAKINEAFQKRGANLRSFDQAAKQAKENIAINTSVGNQNDFKTNVLQAASADIYVEAKVTPVDHPSRSAKSVTIILEAYQTGTANLLASKTIAGPMFQTDDIGRLTAMAVDTTSESFLNLIQLKFDDIVNNGQSVYVEFTAAQDGKTNFDTEIPNTNGKLFSEVLEEWFQTHAVNGHYNSQGATGSKLIISDVRIPLKNPNNPRANYTGANLYADILRYLRSINVQAKREIATNNKILITIL
jgi:hypothetical protein